MWRAAVQVARDMHVSGSRVIVSGVSVVHARINCADCVAVVLLLSQFVCFSLNVCEVFFYCARLG